MITPGRFGFIKYQKVQTIVSFGMWLIRIFIKSLSFWSKLKADQKEPLTNVNLY